VGDVCRGVGRHRARKRPRTPVGPLVRLVERDAEPAREERREADLPLAEELRRDHRVEENPGAEVGVAEQKTEVVVGPMHQEPPGAEPVEKGRERDAGERVDQKDVAVDLDLREADFLEVVVERVGLGVERDVGLGPGVEPVQKGLEGGLVLDQEGIARCGGRHGTGEGSTSQSLPGLDVSPFSS